MTGGEPSPSPGTTRRRDDDPDLWFFEHFRDVARLGFRVREHLHTESSPFQKIDVYQTDFFGRMLTLDDVMMFTERDEFVYHEMLVHVPLCSIPEPRSVLIVGGGDCGCVREALKHSTVERIMLCEIDERVTRVCERWFPWVGEVVADPRVELVFGDGIAEIERHERAFDLIIVDSTDPIGPAVGLFQRAFYDKVARALVEGGVMVAQTETPHWEDALVGEIYRQIGATFAQVATYVGFTPTYPSGMWCWAYASGQRRPDTYVDEARARRIASQCLYYNLDIQRAAFALPTFARRALAGEGPFSRWRTPPQDRPA